MHTTEAITKMQPHNGKNSRENCSKKNKKEEKDLVARTSSININRRAVTDNHPTTILI